MNMCFFLFIFSDSSHHLHNKSLLIPFPSPLINH
jgi:hypothetical protein